MGTRFRNYKIAALNMLTMPIKKLFNISRFYYSFPEIVSPKAILQIDHGGKLILGKKCNIKRGSFIAVLSGGYMKLGCNVSINKDCKFVIRKSIVIEDGVTIGPNCIFYDHDHDIDNIGCYLSKPITIGRNTWIGAGVIVLKGVNIGENCVIAAGTIVTHDVASNTLIYQKRETISKDLMINRG